jgi:8-oxo-dGTP pyrophosphatase MutT (NUDIX family)
MKNENSWNQLTSKIAYQNPWLTVREDTFARPSGDIGMYGVIDVSPSVFIVVLNSDKTVRLIKQYRYPTKKVGWEVPSGGAGNEEPIVAAKRELYEETGLTAEKWTILGVVNPYPGLSNEEAHIFLAEQLTTIRDVQLEAEEEGIVGICSITFSEAISLIHSGEIQNGITITSIFLAMSYLQLLPVNL